MRAQGGAQPRQLVDDALIEVRARAELANARRRELIVVLQPQGPGVSKLDQLPVLIEGLDRDQRSLDMALQDGGEKAERLRQLPQLLLIEQLERLGPAA